jgi:hypothetical protein
MKKITILIAAIALVCFSVPAMAVDWNFYGSARMATFYVSDDYQDDESAYTAGGDDKDSDLQWDLQGNSRLGANVKADHIKGKVELALKGNSSGDVDVGTRLIFGTWNFGAGSLKIGKDYTPVSQFISGQVFDADLGLLGVGTVYGNRVGQAALSFGGFEIALMRADSRKVSQQFVVGGLTFNLEEGDVDKYIPKIEAKWGMSFDAFNFNIMGGYNYFSVEDVVSSKDGKKNDVDVTSYIVGADAGFNFGPAYVKGALSYGQNIGTANWSLPGNRNQGAYAAWDGDDGTKDVNTLQAALVAGMKVSDMLSFEGGFGYRMDDPDSNYEGGDKKSKPWAAYVQSVIVLAPGVYVIPEIGYFDGDQTYAGDDTTKTFYGGAKWQIDF